MIDDIPRDPNYFADKYVPANLRGAATTGYSSLNFPQNYHTVSAANTPVSVVQYPYSQTNVTPGGHVIQYNDTPGGERVLIKHSTGSAVDLLPGGSIEISAAGAGTITITKDFTIIVSGNVKYEVNGDFDLNVKGNFNVKALNYNSSIEGDKIENINGSARTAIAGNQGVTVRGSSSHIIKGTQTNTILGNSNNVTKGKVSIIAGGDIQVAGGGSMKITAPGSVDMSSNSVNIAGQSTTVVGASGTIGGEGVHLYGFNARLTESVFAKAMQADTFHGDLDGTASYAQKADQANTAANPGPSNSIPALTNTSVSGSSTALPNGTLMTEYLTVSSKGIPEVKVDADEEIAKMIDKTVFTGGLSAVALSTNGVRDKLRDEANFQNNDFVAGQVAVGTLNPTALSTAVPAVAGALPTDPSVWRVSNDIGANDAGWIKPAAKPSRKPFLPDFKHYISDVSVIKENTPLMDGIPLSTFLKDKA